MSPKTIQNLWQNLKLKSYSLKRHPTSTVYNNKTLPNLFRKLWYIDNVCFSFISHGFFFPRPSVHWDHQQILREEQKARTYYLLVNCFNKNINYFSRRLPCQILFTSPGAFLPISLVHWVKEKTEDVVWILEKAQLSTTLWNKFPGRILQVSHQNI